MKNLPSLFITIWFAIPPATFAQTQFPVPLDEIARNAVRGCFGGLDCIPSIEYPEMDPAEAANIEPNDLVLGMNLNGVQKAYPLKSLWFHEIVNDSIGGAYYALCYCPLTRTAITVDAMRNGTPFELGVSGLLFNNNLIMYDRSTSPNTFYPQMYFTGVQGPNTGETLPLLALTMMRWKAWKQLFPQTQVIATRFYTDVYYPYGPYRTDDRYFIFPQWVDPRRDAKEMVFGVISQSFKARVYPFADLAPRAVIDDILENENIVIVFDEDSQLAVAFDRSSIEGYDLSFKLAGRPALEAFMQDRETGSTWSVLGAAVDGPLKGRQLRQMTRGYSGYWFAWAAYFKPVEIYAGATAIADEDGLQAVPASFVLEQNYPNPFNPGTTIRYFVPRQSSVKLEILSLTGRVVATLVNGTQRAGWHSVTWNAGAVPTGTYFSRLTAGNRSQLQKMVLVR